MYTDRERFCRTLSFEPVDHCVNYELALWGQTYDRWLAEGLPEDVTVGTLLAPLAPCLEPQMPVQCTALGQAVPGKASTLDYVAALHHVNP